MKQQLSALPNSYKHLIKYGIVGISNLAIYLGVNYLLINNYEYFSNHLLTTNFIAGVISFLNGLYFNRKWTFRSESHWVRDTLYILAIFGICTLVQSGFYAVMINYFKTTSDFYANENQYLFKAQMAGAVLFAGLNFTLNKFITFRKLTESDNSHD